MLFLIKAGEILPVYGNLHSKNQQFSIKNMRLRLVLLVVKLLDSNVPQEQTTSNFRAQVKLQEVCSSKTLVYVYKSTQCYKCFIFERSQVQFSVWRLASLTGLSWFFLVLSGQSWGRTSIKPIH
jgi:hypothetical protein